MRMTSPMRRGRMLLAASEVIRTRAQTANLGEGDSAEGVPEEEGADEQARDCLQQIAAVPAARSCGHAEATEDCDRCAASVEKIGSKGQEGILPIVTSVTSR